MGKRADIQRARRGGNVKPLAPGESVFKPRLYQKLAIEDKSRFKSYMWSRQTGKGFSVALEINDDILEVEAGGGATDWMIISRSLIAARQLGRKVRGIGRALTAARQAIEPTIEDLGESQLELTYPGGSRVLILSSSPDAAVGFTGNVVIDEIDTHKQAFELFGNTFPVVSTGGYRLIVTSTPRGRRVMHRIFADAQTEGSPWSFHKLTIHEAVAQGCDQDPELLRRGIMDELKWRQEYLCEFVDDEICWIPWELIAGCTSDLASVDPAKAAGPAGDGVYLGWDVARWNHLSVLWVIRKKGTALVTVGVVVMQRMPFDEQIATIDRVARMFPEARRLCMDQTGIGEMPFEQASKRLRVMVEGVKFTPSVKEALASDLRRVMEDRSFYIPDDEGIHNDFHSLRRTVTAAGKYRFEGEADGSHADRFWAAGLAIHAAIHGVATPFEFSGIGRPHFSAGGGGVFAGNRRGGAW